MKAQFTLRDLLWLTVVVAMALMWWNDRQAAARFERQATNLKQLTESEANCKITLNDDGTITVTKRFDVD